MCNLDDDWLALLCSANRKLPSWQVETRAQAKTRRLPTSSATPCLWIAIEAKFLVVVAYRALPSLHEQPRGLIRLPERCLYVVDA